MPNYDVLESTASYHGTEIRTKVPTDAYRDGWERIYGQKQKQDSGLNASEGTKDALEAPNV